MRTYCKVHNAYVPNGVSAEESELLLEWVISQEVTRIGEKTTVVCLQMENGHEVIGTSAVTNKNDYVFEDGRLYATKDALKKVATIVAYSKQSASQWF